MTQDVGRYLAERNKRIDTSEIRRVFDLASKLENPINLSIGQPDFPVPEQVQEALIKAVRDNKNAYTPTQGLLQLREAISQKWQSENKLTITTENTIVSTGVASLLYLLFEVLFNSGDGIILTDPYFIIYESLAKYHQLNVFYLPENFNENDIIELQKKIGSTNIKAFIFSSPSNPTGYILNASQLEKISALADKLDFLIISDEIYEKYDYENKFVSMATINPPRTITLGGFSKSHAMTGLRVGYAGVPENLAAIIQKIATLQQYSIVCSPQPSQWAAITALKTSISSQLELMKSRRNLMVEGLKSVLDYYSPDGAFYLFCKINIDSQKFVEEAIKEGLLVVPGYIFSKNRNTIRLSYAQPDEVLKAGLKIIKKIVSTVE